MTNIKSNNYRKIDCRIIDDLYMDFMITKSDVNNNTLSNEQIATILQFNNKNGNHVVSTTAWKNSVQSNDTLDNIGYTGVDNGFISYQRDRIGNDEFLDLFVNSTFNLSQYDDKFFVSEVNGNSGMLVYPIEKMDSYTALKGGFYQGFFKIDGSSYQTLPHRICKEWNFNITLRRKDYDTPSNILNKRNDNNKGTFFYIGTRAENKFWELYKKEGKMEEFKYDNSNDYLVDYDIMDSNVTKHQYHEDVPNPENRDDKYGNFCDCLDYFEDSWDPYANAGEENTCPGHCSSGYTLSAPLSDNLNSYNFNEYSTCAHNNCSSTSNSTNCTNSYFGDDYTGEGTTVGCDCPENDLAIEDDYIQEQISLENLILTDSKGNALGEKGFYEIETDNKFLLFNQTNTGYTINNWKEDIKMVLTGKTDSPTINYYPYLNQTKSGYTKDNVSTLIEEHSYTYNVFKDIENNALSLKINDDGSISYRYLSTDCILVEETTKPNLISYDEWSNVHLKIVRKGDEVSDDCNKYYVPNVMQLYIYVNGKLKLVSKELPELNLRRLDDNSERQEGVPYSISIGGGSQGLCERIFLDYYDRTDYILPIEKNFAGTFIGDIREFKFIPYPMDFATISKLGSGF